MALLALSSNAFETIEHILIAVINAAAVIYAARWGARRERDKNGPPDG